jgi:soluble lytic murein transglycosylase-like protein
VARALGTTDQTARRVLLGTAAALLLTACRTPFGGAGLAERIAAPDAPAPAVTESLPTPEPREPAPAKLEMPISPDYALVKPRLSERLAELLVRHAPNLTPVDRARIAHALESAQEAHQLDPLLVLAIIQQESGFNPKARGYPHAVGLMQIRPFVAQDVAKRHGIPWHGQKTLLDPAANVAIGACYLGEMFDMYPDPAHAISAYNMGPYRVQRMLDRGHSPRPKYLTSVLARYQVFSSQFGPIEPVSIEDADAAE